MAESLISKLTALGEGRRHPTDTFFVAGDEVLKAYERQGVYDIDEEELCHKGLPEFPCNAPGCGMSFTSLRLFEMHYNLLHRHSCSVCKKQLPSSHLLDLHVAENHDSFFKAQSERMPMYQCYVQDCGEKFSTPEERRDHCISVHKYPHNFRFDDSRKQKGKSKKHEKKTKAEVTDVGMQETETRTRKKENVEVTDVEKHEGRHQKGGKRPVKNLFEGKGKRGGRMWHSQKQSNTPKCVDMEFEKVTQDLRESLPDEYE